jgi:hypothetical protein
MGRGIFGKLRGNLEKTGKELPDKRRDGHDLKYRLLDAVKCTFAVFFFQHPSLLNFHQEMQKKLKRNNLETLLEVRDIPCTMQITRLLDGLEPERFSGVFTDNLKLAEQYLDLRDTGYWTVNLTHKFPPFPKNHDILIECLGGCYVRRGKFQYGGRIRGCGFQRGKAGKAVGTDDGNAVQATG